MPTSDLGRSARRGVTSGVTAYGRKTALWCLRGAPAAVYAVTLFAAGASMVDSWRLGLAWWHYFAAGMLATVVLLASVQMIREAR